MSGVEEVDAAKTRGVRTRAELASVRCRDPTTAGPSCSRQLVLLSALGVHRRIEIVMREFE